MAKLLALFQNQLNCFLGKIQRLNYVILPSDLLTNFYRSLPPHLPASLVVVQVHECPGVPLLPLLGVHKGLAETHGVVHMVAAATPVKRALGVLR